MADVDPEILALFGTYNNYIIPYFNKFSDNPENSESPSSKSKKAQALYNQTQASTQGSNLNNNRH